MTKKIEILILTYKVFLNYKISILRPVRMERKKVMMQDLAGAPGEEKVSGIDVSYISLLQHLKLIWKLLYET